MCRTCSGSKVAYQFKGSIVMLGPCPECNPNAKKEIKPYEYSSGQRFTG
ncbi:hypothetical protein ABEW24_24035 [Paenibacillus jamilae]